MAAVKCEGVGLLVQGMAIWGLGCIIGKAYVGWEPGVLRDPGNRGPQRMGVCLQILWLKGGWVGWMEWEGGQKGGGSAAIRGCE